MRKSAWLAIMACLVVSAPAFAAEKKPAKKPAAAAKAYVCTHCQVALDKAGKCPKCQATLAQADVAYKCPKCGAESAKAGKCAKCKVDLQKQAALYHCDGCKGDFTTGGT